MPLPVSPDLFEAGKPFVSVANIIDALPDSHHVSDATPLRDVLPGVWPTVGELRKLRDALEYRLPSAINPDDEIPF